MDSHRRYSHTTEHHTLDAKLSALTEFAAECEAAKVFGSETCHALSNETIQISGSNSFSEEYPAARMYRDSRITRIYEGTSEICCLGITKSILKSFERWSFVLPTSDTSVTSMEPNTTSTLHSFKAIYHDLLRQLIATVGAQNPIDIDKQIFLTNLATIAIDLHAAERTILRVARLAQTRVDVDLSFAKQLSRLGVEQASRSIHHAVVEILSALHAGDALRTVLANLQRKLPLQPNMVTLRGSIACTLAERGGALPHFPLV